MTKEMEQERRRVPIGQAAREIGVSTQTLRNWIRAGLIKADRLPSGRHRIDMVDYVKRQAKKAA